MNKRRRDRARLRLRQYELAAIRLLLKNTPTFSVLIIQL